MRVYGFEKLVVWQKARAFRKEIYLVTKKFPQEERYGFTAQIRDAASSITRNLAEGSGRVSPADKANFTNIALSSCLEVIDHLIGVLDLGFIDEQEYLLLRKKADEIFTMLDGLYKYQLNEETNLKTKLKK